MDASDIDSDGRTANNPGEGAEVLEWKDKSGNHHDFRTAGSSPNLRFPPGSSSLKKLLVAFNGQNEGLEGIYSLDHQQEITLFMVTVSLTTKEVSNPGPPVLSWKQTGNTPEIYCSPQQSMVHWKLGEAPLTPEVIEPRLHLTGMAPTLSIFKRTQTLEEVSLQGKTVFSKPATAISFSAMDRNVYLGKNSSGSYFDGSVAEIVIYSEALSPKNQEQVEVYLAEKWGAYHPKASWIQSHPAPTQTLIHQQELAQSTMWLTDYEIPLQVAIFSENLATDPSAFMKNSLALWMDASDSKTLFRNQSCNQPVSNSGGIITCWQDKSKNFITSPNPIL